MSSPESQEIWDVIVVGAGPAGASAAKAAAEAGARTLIVDRAKLPRYKTCGGGLLGASLRSLPEDIEIPVHDSIRTISFTLRGRFPSTHRSDRDVLKMVSRDTFDYALVEASKGAGASIYEGTSVRSVQEEADSVILATSSGDLRARALVGCDGSASRVGRYVGVEVSQVDLGLELEIEAGADIEKWRSRVHLDWGPINGSYGWVFSKGESLTVGVIAAKGNGEATRKYLETFVKGLHLDKAVVLRDSGHLTRCRSATSPMSRGRILVAGDAAGLLEPWTREGISFAIRSGKLAGTAAAEIAKTSSQYVGKIGESYAAIIDEGLGREMRAGAEFMKAFSVRPGLFHAAIALTPLGWEAFEKLTSGSKSFPEAYERRAVPTLLKVAAFKPTSLCRSVRQ